MSAFGPLTAFKRALVARVGQGMRGAACLSNGDYRTVVTALGGGASFHGPFALDRGSGDRGGDGGSFQVWVAERAEDRCWPVAGVPLHFGEAGVEFGSWFGPNGVNFLRRQDGLAARVEIGVHAAWPFEVRRVTIGHAGTDARTVEIAAALEVVLHLPGSDAAHPAFSRLFVQTEWDPTHRILLARRRPRAADEVFPWVGLALLDDELPQLESDRARFLGRAFDRERPRALVGPGRLEGTTGDVLDPVLALSVERDLEPGESASVAFALVAGDDRAAVLDTLARGRALGAERFFAPDGPRAGRADEVLDPAALAAAGLEVASVATEPDEPFRPGGADRRAKKPKAERSSRPRLPSRERLSFANGFGGFSADGSEYVVRFDAGARGTAAGADEDGARPPLPWVNVLANETFGALVSETGAGSTWSVNSRERRLSPWSNDPLLDPHGEAVWVRDERTSEFVSPLPGPTPGGGPCEVRHGFGRTRYLTSGLGLDFECDVFVPRRDPVKLVRVRMKNRGTTTRRLSFVAFQRLALTPTCADGEANAGVVTSSVGMGNAFALLARTPSDPRDAGRVTFAALVPEQARIDEAWRSPDFTTSAWTFTGWDGGLAHPRALLDDEAYDGTLGAVPDPCFAQARAFELGPGETASWTVLFGDAADADEAARILEFYRRSGTIDRALEEVLAFWSGLTSAVRVETPMPALDVMLNGWLAYQTVACRMWGRTAFYQSGGAFGFRDQLQDASALLHYAPAVFRAQIVLHAAHQFVEGDVLHWWHPPDSRGLRTRFADDLLWLPWMAATYVQATGDDSVLDEPARFLVAPALEDDEDEVFLTPEPAPDAQAADVYEHACRAIERSLQVGSGVHGLPLFGSGDWNDGMNRVGQGGKGESVWMAFFLARVLSDFAPLCRARGDEARAAGYDAERARLAEALEAHGWDGAWYRRGYYDDGTPLGSASSDECRIDALAQAWAVISGAVPLERAEAAMDAADAQLVDEKAGIVRLLDPPFEHTAHDPGYIKGYVAGVRENGGQYTHAALWVVRALAELGRRDRAASVLEMLSPVSHARTPGEVATYQVEPYVIAADVYGRAPHVGRGGWTWYTGSAGWMIRVALESVLGVTIEGGTTLVVLPRIPDAWPGFTVRRRLPDGTTYVVSVRGAGGGLPNEIVVAATVDGAEVPLAGGGARIALAQDGATHAVAITLGPHT